MAITITAEQRDALYDLIVGRLSGIGDVWLAARTGDFEAAQRLSLAYSDDLRLLAEDLGWGDGAGEAIELRTPPDVLRRAVSRMRETARKLDAQEEEERAELRANESRNHLMIETCQSVLADLDRAQQGP